MLNYTPTPVQEIYNPLFDKAGVRVLVKREDLNHPLVSGNKWWKLKYNLEEAKNQGKKTLLTFGGAYSNHLYATAAAAQELGLKSIGVVRGEETLPLNSTLTFAREMGMQLHYISREHYRNKNSPGLTEQLHQKFGDFYLIPEGGTNALAVKGVAEFAQTLGSDFDYLCCAVGTGGTLAGLILGLTGTKEILGFAVLKGADFLRDDIERLIGLTYKNWKIVTEYHFGGYGKVTPVLIELIKEIQQKNNIALDVVYTSKVFAGVYEMIEEGCFNRGTTLQILHTGGLQTPSKL